MRKGKDGFYNRYTKRIFDFLIAFVAIIVLSPLLLIMSIVGAIGMKGNPFFCQKRPGKKGADGNEEIFTLLKFRTMTNEKDEDGNLLPDEKRLNGYGKFLRSTSLDELPELFNIIVGDLSFVGPRPLLVRYLDRYTDHQRHRHDVRQGLTGFAQVHGRNELSWDEKFEMDIWYTQNVSFMTDIKILFDTVKVVLKHEGISSATSATMEEFIGLAEADKIHQEVSV